MKYLIQLTILRDPYGILKINTFDNNMTLITTHYSKLSKLGKQLIINLKIINLKLHQNEIIYTL